MSQTPDLLRSTKKASALTLMLIALSISCYAQTGIITGVVVDAATSKPLPFASVYVNRTTIGAEADTDGKFTLTKLPAGNFEIVCSFVGYQSTKVEVQVSEGQQKELTIKLSRLSNELEAVTITAEKDNEWKKDYAQFRKVFLGKDDFADKCEIVNAGVLEFSKAKGNALTAVASQPLEVLNPELGYRVIYELLQFSYSPKQYSIFGNIRFEVMETDDPNLQQRWMENRRKAYERSLRYFFKSIFDNRIREHGFDVFVENEPEAKLSRASMFSYVRNIVKPFRPELYLKKTADARFFVLTLPARMEIHDRRQLRGSVYKDVPASVSWLETNEPLIISRNGLVQNPPAVELIGYMSEARVAQLLPEDYTPDNVKAPDALAPEKSVSVTERIYLHTDKDYYYPGEVLWFKGYMNYGDQPGIDSMSRVGYVELIDSTRKILVRKVMPIELGTFSGAIDLPANLSEGNYVLRSYTEYMRNLGEKNFFMKPIPVLNAFQKVTEVARREQQQKSNVAIEPSKTKYKKRDEIQLTISVQDEDGSYVPAELSVAVVDAELFKGVPEGKSFQEYFRPAPEAPDDKKYRIERGITLRGKFSAGRKLAEPVKVTAVLGKFEDVNTLTTDREGNFYLTGFQFYDSSNIALQVINKKGKPYGEFELLKTDTPAVNLFPVVHLNLVRSMAAVPRSTDFEPDAVQLREVTVTGKKERRSHDLYGGGFKLDWDYIKTTNYPDIISLMQARLRGVRILQRMDAGGFMREVISVSGMGGSPLLVVDGLPYGDQTDVARSIRQISIREVQSIEVLRGPAAAVFGTRGMGGAILINTRAASGNFEDVGFNIPDNTFTYFPFFGYSATRTFKYPDYKSGSRNDRPDFRTTLYWNPTVWLDGTESQTLSFTSGDIASTFRVTVKGVTLNGEPVSGEAFITVAE